MSSVKHKALVSIVIPNYNGKRFLRTCLSSLIKQTYDNFEVIFVDDGSSDDSVDFVKENFPDVKIIIRERGGNFSATVNTGIRKAKGKFIALLNNDTETDSRWIEEVIIASKKYQDASFFASKMLDYKDRSIIDSCGDGMTWSGRSYKIGELEKDGLKFNKPEFVFGACAGAAVYRKEVFDTIGLFDEDFGFYLEDVDIDFRAQLAGFKCLFVPKAIVYHIGSATAGKHSPFSFKMSIKNHFHVIYKNFPTKYIVHYSPLIFYSELRFFAASIKHRFVKEYFWACHKAFQQRKVMRLKRKENQNTKILNDEGFKQLFKSNFPIKY